MALTETQLTALRILSPKQSLVVETPYRLYYVQLSLVCENAALLTVVSLLLIVITYSWEKPTHIAFSFSWLLRRLKDSLGSLTTKSFQTV